MSAMIVHHEGAIDMTRQAQTNTRHKEIKAIAENIIAAQSREIDQMNAWATT